MYDYTCCTIFIIIVIIKAILKIIMEIIRNTYNEKKNTGHLYRACVGLQGVIQTQTLKMLYPLNVHYMYPLIELLSFIDFLLLRNLYRR